MRASARTLLVVVLALLSALCFARHPANLASARAKIAVDGSFDLRIRFDVLAFCLDMTPSEVADGPMNALLDGPAAELESTLADAKKRFVAHLRMLGDGGQATVASFSFPTSADVLNEVATGPSQRLPVMVVVEVKGRLPKGAKTSSFQFPDMLGQVVLTTEFPYEEPVSEPVDPGSTSTSLTLPSADQVAQVESAIAKRAAAEAAAPTVHPAVHPSPAPAADPLLDARADAVALGVEPPKPPLAKPAAAPGRMPVVQSVQPASIQPIPELPSQALPWYTLLPRYVKMGYLHIVPQGLDHILFVLGLFLLSTRMKDLLKQITAFTVAHSLTLALSLYGVVRLPPTVVEPIIALSIVFVAVENLFTAKMHKWRVGVVFLFGLVHGLGFATALKDAGLAHGDFLTALVGFNSGVELGQLSVVAGAFLLVGWFRSHERYRPYVTVPASLAIALVALFWTVQRIV